MNTASTSSSRISATAPWCTTHPLTERDQAVMSQMRTLVEPNKGKLRGVAARPAFEGIIRRAAAPERVIYRADRIGGIPGWWCEPADMA